MKKDGFAIVTGGSRGLGEGMALRLAKEGYDVVVNYVSDKSAAKADEVVREIEKYGVKGLAVQADVSDYEKCKKIVDEGVSAFGKNIAVLVNNAGIESGKSYLDITEPEYRNMINVALLGQMNCVHLVLPYMVQSNQGCIINISSVVGMMGVENQIDYAAAKGGIIGMTKAMAKEFAKYNIRVNSIAPGMIWTDMLKGTSQEGVEFLKSITPLKMIGDVGDIADCMAYIVGAKFLTGQIISPNGGLTI